VFITRVLISILAFATANASVLNEYGLLDDIAYGQYGKLVTVSQVRANHNNFGIGAGVGLGELIILDGTFYLTDPHGHPRILDGHEGLSIVTATDFKPQNKFVIQNVNSLHQLQQVIDSHINNKHEIYAIKITGTFDKIHARSENFDKPPYTPAVVWMKTNQNVFDYNAKPATIVMFRTPSNLSNIQVPYHAHFISKDGKMGGHVFDLSGQNLTIEMEPLDRVDLLLRTSFDNVKDINAEAGKFNAVIEPGSMPDK